MYVIIIITVTTVKVWHIHVLPLFKNCTVSTQLCISKKLIVVHILLLLLLLRLLMTTSHDDDYSDDTTSLLMCARAAVIHRDMLASIRARRRLLHRQLLAGEQELELREKDAKSADYVNFKHCTTSECSIILIS